MAKSMVEELSLFALGVVLEEAADWALTTYGDTQANLNIATLKDAGKPSVYLNGLIGIGGIGYPLYQADKKGMVKDEEMVLFGAGIAAGVKVVRRLIAPSAPAKTTAVTIRGVSVIEARGGGGGGGAIVKATEGYMKAPAGFGGTI